MHFKRLKFKKCHLTPIIKVSVGYDPVSDLKNIISTQIIQKTITCFYHTDN